MVEQDYYELLGVQRAADDAAIKAAYRRMAKEYHPDRKNGCKDNEAHFKAINQAYDVLKDPQKRAAYDRFGHAAFQNGGGGDPFAEAGFNGFSDIFSTIFGEFMDQRGARQNAARGADLRYDIELSLEEAFTGAEKTITVEALANARPATVAAAPARSLRQPLPDLRRHGQDPHAARLLHGRARLPHLPRLGRSDHQSVRQLPRRRPRAHPAQAVGEDSRRRRRRHPDPRRRRRRGRVRGAAQRRPLPVRPHEAAPDLRARGHDA